MILRDSESVAVSYDVLIKKRSLTLAILER